MPNDNLWYKNAIIYSLDVATYQDSNNDGIGDFPGLTSRLDYLAGLGVTCLWLLPFYPSPDRDNGYDITDYYNLDPRFGTLGDFVVFLRQARERGIRVLIDLVVNHTSDQHPWFQAARRDRHSPYRDYYVWTARPPAHQHAENIFPGEERSVWTKDAQAGAYYFHRFYHFEPDLQNRNPAVQEEVKQIMGFWLALGVAGFRVDAAPHLIRPKGGDTGPARHDLLREMRAFVASQRGDAILLAEADVEASQLASYFGDGDEMQLLFNFILDNYLFLALARERSAPLAQGLSLLPALPRGGQWANFLRNQDELDLERLTPGDRHAVFQDFAPQPSMRIYGRGIRRRLAPMVAGDERRLKLAWSLLLTLPGTPVLLYGDEIGMGENLALPGRWDVRTPMQWSDEPQGGFSGAPADRLVRPLISDGPFGYRRVNVAAQRRNPGALLNAVERAIRTRRECPEFGRGQCHLVDTDQPGVFAHRCAWGGSSVLAVHNLTGQPCTPTITCEEHEPAPRLIELYSDRAYDPLTGGTCRMDLAAYGYRWFRLAGDET